MTTTTPPAGGSPGTLTRATAGEVLAALRAAQCPPSALYWAAAQSALETATWSAMWNWNVGNITTKGRVYVLLPGLGQHFAAYASLEAGARAFVGYLDSHHVLEATSLEDYCARLDAIPYATAPGGYTGKLATMRALVASLSAAST